MPNLPTVTISGTALSDLFFNWDEGTMDNLSPEEWTQDQLLEVKTKDANKFISDHGLEGQVEPENLALDFIHRL